MRKSDIESRLRRILAEVTSLQEDLEKVRGFELKGVLKNVKLVEVHVRGAIEKLKTDV